jgi:predicted cupin superfamily sugar epimerase
VGYASNQSYDPENLNDFFKKGDLINKTAGSDSLIIKRKNISYLFILNAQINESNFLSPMNKSIQSIIKKLDLQPHPEGGYFKETYRSDGTISASNLTSEFSGKRNFSTSIYYMLISGEFSAFHKINQDEIWHFYNGSPIELHIIDESGKHAKYLIGRDLSRGEASQLVVPANCWFASKVVQDHSYSLVGCTVAPGFDFDDFVLADRKEMTSAFPQHKELILEFTRD